MLFFPFALLCQNEGHLLDMQHPQKLSALDDFVEDFLSGIHYIQHLVVILVTPLKSYSKVHIISQGICSSFNPEVPL